MEDVLGFCALVLTMLMMVGVSAWFCCSIVESLAKMRRGLKKTGYNALLRQNKRLKSFLANGAEENLHRRKGYYTDVIRRKNNHVSRDVA